MPPAAEEPSSRLGETSPPTDVLIAAADGRVLAPDSQQQTPTPAAVLQTALSSISQGILMLDVEGRVQTYNSRLCELLDLPASLLDSRPTLEQLTQFQLKRGDFGAQTTLVDLKARTYVAAGGKGQLPAHYLRTTRAGRTLEIKTQTLPGAGMVRTFADVSDYMQAEQARARLNLLLEATQALAQVGGWEVDIVNDKVYWTSEVYRMLDTSPAQYTPSTATTIHFFVPESARAVQAAIRAAETQGKTHDLELEMITAKGRRIWVHSRSSVVRENGRVIKRTSVLQDITERKQAEAALRASEELFRQITSQMPGMVYRIHIDPNGLRHYLFVSPGVRELYGVEPEAVMTQRGILRAMTHPDDHPRVEDTLAAMNDQAVSVSIEFRIILVNGSVKWVQLDSKVASSDQNGKVFNCVMQDITVRKQAEAALRASEELFRQITAQMPGMVYRLHIGVDGTRRFSFISRGVRELYGVEPEAVMADGRILHQFRHPLDRPALEAGLYDVAAWAQPLFIEFRIILADGTLKWVEMNSTAVQVDASGVVRVGVMVDITARKTAEEALRQSEERWKLALESTGDGVWDWYVQSGVEIFSKRYLEMYGYTEQELQQRPEEFDSRTHPDDREQMQRDRQAHFDGLTPTYVNEHRVRCKDGSWKWVLTRGMVVSRDNQGRPLRMIGTHTDISNRKQSEALIWQQANFDTLTGLPNRRMLRDRLEQDLRRSQREGLQLAILFIDLDHFKEVNDTLGHDNGDLLLVEAARRVRHCVRNSDTVARMGGDEFTVVLTELHDPTQLERILGEILQAMSTLFQLGTEQVFISASIGITMFPTDGEEVEDLFKNADQALYVAKGAGRNRFSFFTPALQEAAQLRVRLANDLRSGLADSQFRLVYQPIVELASGAVHKAEALLRWQHPSRGLVSPAEFIPIAESSGLIIDIGEWVFRQAVAQVQAWRAALHPQFQISVNRSPVQFHAGIQGQNSWVGYLREQRLPGSCLAVEITEGLLLDTSSAVTDQLLALRDAGIQVSLDDFGTGYSSLTYLQKFDIDYIKIDQSFVRNLSSTSTDLALCKAIIVMAHELGMKVIAEGVETTQQRDLLLAAGCDYGQGYLFARPMAAQDFEARYNAAGATTAPG